MDVHAYGIAGIYSGSPSSRAGRQGRGERGKRDTININLGNEPPTLDWSMATDVSSYTVLNNIMEGLTQFDAEFHPLPALAEAGP
ncbi:MAG: hypothetical protein R3B51_02860 [Thermodesulfobacteriota bacterium]